MVIKNITRGTIVSASAKEAKSAADRILGLLKKSNPRTLIIKTRFGIHTFFLEGPIDVIILDKNQQVVKCKQKLHPNRIFLWNPKYSIVIEMPAGSIRKAKTALGDTLILT